MRKFRQIVEKEFGRILKTVQVSGNAFQIIGNGFNLKLDIFQKSPEPLEPWWIPGSDPVPPQYKMYKSLPVHKKAIELGLYVPGILKIVYDNGKVYKFTQWINGNPIGIIKENQSYLIPKVFQNFGKYIAIFNKHSITPCDPHFANFVWTDVGCVIIDMKKFLFTSPDVHVLQMGKITLKSCRSCRKTAVNFLKGYSEINSPINIIKYLDGYSWSIGKHTMDRISLEEIYEQPRVI